MSKTKYLRTAVHRSEAAAARQTQLAATGGDEVTTLNVLGYPLIPHDHPRREVEYEDHWAKAVERACRDTQAVGRLPHAVHVVQALAVSGTCSRLQHLL